MSFAWLLFLIIIAVLSNLAQDRYKYHNVFRVLLVILLAFITGFGGLTAADHSQYAEAYKVYNSFDNFELSFSSLLGRVAAYESGFMLLMILCNAIGLGEAGFFFVVALFVNGALIYYIYKHKLPVVALWAVFVSGFIGLQTNLIRQSLALAIILLFLDNLSEGKILKYLLGVLLASMFHTSAFLFLILLPICFIKTENGIKVLNTILIGLVFISIFIWFGIIEVNILSYIDIIEAYEKYMSADNEVGGSQRIAHSVIFTGVSLLVSFLYGKLDIKSATIISLAAIVSNISMAYPNFERLKCYFVTLGYISLVQYFDITQYKNKQDKVIVKSVYVIFALYFVLVILRTYWITETPPVFGEVYSFDKFFK